MTPQGSKGLKRCFWIFIGSFFLTPLALWGFVTVILGRDYSFRRDYLDFYRDMFSPHPDMAIAWLILLVPVVLYELALACCHYYHHPEHLRSIFEFPSRHRR